MEILVCGNCNEYNYVIYVDVLVEEGCISLVYVHMTAIQYVLYSCDYDISIWQTCNTQFYITEVTLRGYDYKFVLVLGWGRMREMHGVTEDSWNFHTR